MVDNEFLNKLSNSVKASEAKLQELQIEIDKAKRVGANVVEAEQKYNALKSQVDRIKSVYGV